MTARFAQLIRFVAIASVCGMLSACNFRFVMSDGYTFDFQGEQGVALDSGVIPDGTERVVIENRFGTVRAQPAQLGDAMWSWEVTCWSNSLEEANTFAKQCVMERKDEAQTSFWRLVLPDAPQPGLRGLKSDLTLNLPPQVTVRIDNRGDVILERLQGPLTIKNRHGNVTLHSLLGDLAVDNQHGNIEAVEIASAKLINHHGALSARDVGGDLQVQSHHTKVDVTKVKGSVELECHHGEVAMDDLNGNVKIGGDHCPLSIQRCSGDLQIDSSHATVRARDVAGRVRIESNHGNMDLDLLSANVDCQGSHSNVLLELHGPVMERVKISTQHGSIQTRIPGDASTVVSASAEHGNVNSEFPTTSSVDGSPLRFQARHGNIRILKIQGE